MVGRIGRAPAYIPGGPLPPNFASVIDHSRLAWNDCADDGRGGQREARPLERAIRWQSIGALPRAAYATGSTFAAPGAGSSSMNSGQMNSGRGYNRSGHVFAAPASPNWSSQGYAAPWSPSVGGGMPSGQGSAVPMHSSGGVSHAAGSGAAAPRRQSKIAVLHICDSGRLCGRPSVFDCGC